MKHKLVALILASVWIVALCTVPQLLGGGLWRRFGAPTDLPVGNLLSVALNSLAVVVFIFVTRRGALLVPRRPERPLLFLLLVPLILLNVLRGPLREPELLLGLVLILSNFLTGFWEEFLFRGIIQPRLAVLGPRLGIFAATAMFALIHVNRGPIGLLVTFSIGLAFALTLRGLGLWPLVIAHFLIDLVSDVFRRGWAPFQTIAYVVIGIYLVLGMAALIHRRGPDPAADEPGPGHR